MPSPNIERIGEKVRRLLALATSSNEHEAAAAAAKAQELMFKYKLTAAQIPGNPDAESPITHLNFQDEKGGRWRFRLLAGVGRYNFCSVGKYRYGRKEYAIVGKPEDIEVVVYLFTYLAREVEKFAAEKRGNNLGLKWLTAYKRGLVDVIVYRLKQQQDTQAAESVESTALVVTIKAALSEYMPMKGRVGDTKSHNESSGYRVGISDGRDIPINKAVEEAQ